MVVGKFHGQNQNSGVRLRIFIHKSNHMEFMENQMNEKLRLFFEDSAGEKFFSTEKF